MCITVADCGLPYTFHIANIWRLEVSVLKEVTSRRENQVNVYFETATLAALKHIANASRRSVSLTAALMIEQAIEQMRSEGRTSL